MKNRKAGRQCQSDQSVPASKNSDLYWQVRVLCQMAMFQKYCKSVLLSSFETLVVLILTPVTNLLSFEWTETSLHVPVTSRAHQTYSGVTGVMIYGPYWQPCKCFTWPSLLLKLTSLLCSFPCNNVSFDHKIIFSCSYWIWRPS